MLLITSPRMVRFGKKARVNPIDPNNKIFPCLENFISRSSWEELKDSCLKVSSMAKGLEFSVPPTTHFLSVQCHKVADECSLDFQRIDSFDNIYTFLETEVRTSGFDLSTRNLSKSNQPEKPILAQYL